MLPMNTPVRIVNTSSELDGYICYVKGIAQKHHDNIIYILDLQLEVNGYTHLTLTDSCIEVL